MEKGYYVIDFTDITLSVNIVAIHNKNGKGLLLAVKHPTGWVITSQSTIKMEKGYYLFILRIAWPSETKSQSTIKMEKGYYNKIHRKGHTLPRAVAIHNKNGKGLLPTKILKWNYQENSVAIHNKNGKGLLPMDLRLYW